MSQDSNTFRTEPDKTDGTAAPKIREEIPAVYTSENKAAQDRTEHRTTSEIADDTAVAEITEQATEPDGTSGATAPDLANDSSLQQSALHHGNGSQAWIFDPSLRAALLATLPTYNSETRWADEDDFDEEELDEDDVDEDYRDDDHNEENVDGENLDDDHLEEEGLEDEDIDESDLDEDAFFEFEPPSRSSSKDNFRKKDDGYDGDECDVDTSGGAFRAQAEEQPLTGKKQLDEYDSELRKTTLKKDDGTMIQKDQLAERDSEMKDTTSANVLGKKQYKRGRRGGAREREKKARKIELGLIDPDATPEEAAKRKPKAEDKAFRKNASKIRKRTGHEGKVVHGMTEGGAARKRIQRGKKRGSANKGPSGTREKEPTVTVQTVARKPVDRICVKGEDPKMEEGFRDAKAAEQSVNLCR